ncbi:hypothetical protein K7X08_002805 [Anisodus acutangulus]|uniref:V-type proton ATPase subunit G n=1 Tax=Anisodus acutangulus TaxID=402998 RepID=A0A9Q1MCF8_9SOLA|nr:hypothetical protein K7X08_002805 [Anisodus acutangulus]
METLHSSKKGNSPQVQALIQTVSDLEAAMDSMRGQGGIQMLLTAEQEAQQIVYAARNVKMTRLRQAKEEAEMEVTNYRFHLEAEYKQKLSETSGSSDSTEKRLEVETEQKIQHLKKAGSKVSPDVIAMLMKYITTIKT